MFSDVVSYCLSSIIKRLRTDYAFQDVYPKEVVVNMIASMLLTIAVSDARDLDGTFFNSCQLEDLRNQTLKRANEIYEEKMGE